MASFQILSDLHLEHNNYSNYRIVPTAPYLALIGDIGCVKDPGYIGFIRGLLDQFRVVFYVFGNHEPYGSSWDNAWETLDKFEKANRSERKKNPESAVGEFVFMYQREYRIPDSHITVLGCTLFSNVPSTKMTPVSNGLNDFREIDGWTVEEHCQLHKQDLAWLNSRVNAISVDSDRKIVIFTHYSPTEDTRAVEPCHAQSDIKSGFQTDLRNEDCWKSPNVKVWAFGHTHYNCDFVDEATGKRLYTNQKGYSQDHSPGFREGNVVHVD
ncbi:calcineurin-like phosphoesterase [Colletotrichum scovillei]|uniref:Ser/Thr protein phosphatase superfamily n=1 Tax=Colletotrichum scovillei TaxID=1209932 RepID=A0A9P7RH87_9PEZI|nr:calcineurin-like phosphoesterase [Colletotrichum scovillei]KAF4773834.1 calcineurin-like phosphoesterase [Colletotrichum scovillei]KAG7056114.1 Ser/Thr protein phosphatase superfamily [Colletotrichum scovillei]KAG7075557.1 Ser/Thr protein phosphatase superfamily [Colletotrichum scovillei]KAG7082607.1 Ser/Thr protein phosphatase superfamily [Colletotrichum scovillei]